MIPRLNMKVYLKIFHRNQHHRGNIMKLRLRKPFQHIKLSLLNQGVQDALQKAKRKNVNHVEKQEKVLLKKVKFELDILKNKVVNTFVGFIYVAGEFLLEFGLVYQIRRNVIIKNFLNKH